MSKKVLTVGDKFSKLGINQQLSYEIGREFVNDSAEGFNFDSMRVGSSQEFHADDGTMRMEVTRVSNSVFKITDQNIPSKTYNPRNNPTPSGADNASFGMGFAASGGNSPSSSWKIQGGKKKRWW